MNGHHAPTIEDVAVAAGVSRSTVSRVINDDEKVSARTRAAVNQAVNDLAYAPNPAARSLARSRFAGWRDAAAS